MKLDSGQYLGNTDQSLNLAGLYLTKVNYRNRSVLPLHYHQNAYFCYVLTGAYSEHTSKSELTCAAGDIIFHPSEIEHHNQFNDRRSTCFNIELPASWRDKLSEPGMKFNSTIKTSDTSIQQKVIKIYKEFLEPDLLSPLMIEGLLLETLVSFSRGINQTIPVPYFVRKVRKYIDERYATNPGLQELANLSAVSPEHLIRMFRKAYHTTPGEYMRQVKVKHGCQLLKHSNRELADIAIELAFADQSHFNRVFKNTMGVTPLAYRLSK